MKWCLCPVDILLLLRRWYRAAADLWLRTERRLRQHQQVNKAATPPSRHADCGHNHGHPSRRAFDDCAVSDRADTDWEVAVREMMVVVEDRFVAVVTVYGMPGREGIAAHSRLTLQKKADCEELLRRKFAHSIKKAEAAESSTKS